MAICGRDAGPPRDGGGVLVRRRVLTVVADVSEPPTPPASSPRPPSGSGPVDMLVANGPAAGRRFASTEARRLRGGARLNLLSTVALCRAAVPGMLGQGWGPGRGHHLGAAPASRSGA